MRLEILFLPGCAGARVLSERLREVIGERPGFDVSARAIGGPQDAAAHGMAGSPTLLVDGIDVFATPDHPGASISCRLHLPSTERLRAALGLAGP